MQECNCRALCFHRYASTSSKRSKTKNTDGFGIARTAVLAFTGERRPLHVALDDCPPNKGATAYVALGQKILETPVIRHQLFSSGPHCLTAKQTALILRLYARCELQYIVTVSIKRKRNPLSKGILSQPRIRHCDLIRVYNFACWVGIINSCSDRIYMVNIKSGCMVKSTKSGTILLVHLQQYQLDSFFCGQSNHYLNKQTYAEEK